MDKTKNPRAKVKENKQALKTQERELRKRKQSQVKRP